MAQQINVPKEILEKIIVEGDAQTLVSQAKTVGSELRQGLTTNQIRAIFSTVRQIDMSWRSGNQKDAQAQRRLILLKPKMLYRAAREGQRGQGLKSLSEILGSAIDLVVDENASNNRTRFTHFVDFFEAILAYHKVAGGN